MHNRVRQDKLGDEREEDEGVIVYKAATPANRQLEVYGTPIYTDKSEAEKQSPTRTIQQKYGHRMHGKKTDVSVDLSFGKPTFYATDPYKNTNDNNIERPILAILREVLKNNHSRNVSVKDVLLRNTPEKTETKNTMMENLPSNQNRKERYKLEFPWQISGHKKATHRKNVKTEITTSYTESTTTSVQESSYHSINIYDEEYPVETKDSWPYRTDDKYSLFYLHPPAHNSEEKFNPKHGHVDQDDAPVYVYDDDPAKDSDNLNAPYLDFQPSSSDR